MIWSGWETGGYTLHKQWAFKFITMAKMAVAEMYIKTSENALKMTDFFYSYAI